MVSAALIKTLLLANYSCAAKNDKLHFCPVGKGLLLQFLLQVGEIVCLFCLTSCSTAYARFASQCFLHLTEDPHCNEILSVFFTVEKNCLTVKEQ